MLDAMIKKNVNYDSEFYPNKNHGISGGKTRYHLYNKMLNFWLEKLQKKFLSLTGNQPSLIAKCKIINLKSTQ